MEEFISFLANDVFWSTPVIYILLGVGLIFSILTRFLQVRHIKDMVKLMFQGKSSSAGVSSFQALAISLSGRVGTGNIAGVASAIYYGGPGAVFWMWMIAFIGASSAFVESTLAQIYKVKKDGVYRGGPAYYIEKGIGWKWFAVLFAGAAIVAMAILMPGVQSNAIAGSFKEAFNIPTYITGAAIVLLLGFIILGGIKRIAQTAQLIVPFMAIGYILVSLVVIAFNITEVPAVISLIVTSAFGADSLFGGLLGSAIAWGVKRGVYSNEAGQGTGAHPAAAAEVSHPAKQGLVQAFSVYIDTLFVCSATAFMILFTGMYNVTAEDEQSLIVNNLGDTAEINESRPFTQLAVDEVLPGFGSGFVAVSLFFFAFTTIMAYYYIAETNIAYLMKQRAGKIPIFILKIVILAATFYGSVKTANLAWALGDIGLGIMVWLNIIAIVILAKPALITLKDYERQKKEGKDPVFNPKELGIKNADYWEQEDKKKKTNIS